MIETIEILPCPIEQSFDPMLLTHPIPKYSHWLWEYYQLVKEKLMRRAKYSPQKYKKCLELEEEFLKLYERAKHEEENPQKVPRNKAEGPFYHPWFANKGDQNLYRGLR